jgi:hypothetical protein
VWTSSTISSVIGAARRHVESFASLFIEGPALPSHGLPAILRAFPGGIARRRDFSQARKQELINASRHFSTSEFWELPEHFWLRAERLASEAYPPAGDFSVAKNYARGAAQANRYGIQRIETVFREAYATDSEYASRIRAEAQAVRQATQALKGVVGGIGTLNIASDRVVFA